MSTDAAYPSGILRLPYRTLFPILSVSALFTLILILAVSHVLKRLLPQPTKTNIDDHRRPEPTALTRALTSALPGSVILPTNPSGFERSMNSYWAQQECEVVPACVIEPRSATELSTAIILLHDEYKARSKEEPPGHGLFAVRGGGHSPVPNAASIDGGVVIDLSLFKEVTPSEDRSCVVIGAGCRWRDVSKVLDRLGLAVVGGRNSAVGVGGLTLGGELSPDPPYPCHILSPWQITEERH